MATTVPVAFDQSHHSRHYRQHPHQQQQNLHQQSESSPQQPPLKFASSDQMEKQTKSENIESSSSQFSKMDDSKPSKSKIATTAPITASDKTSCTELPSSVKSFAAIIESIGFMGVSGAVLNQFRQIYPMIRDTELRIENRNGDISLLGDLFKCDPYHHGCHFTASDSAAFRAHLRERHPKQSLFCFYCNNHTGPHQSCHTDADHRMFGQAEQLVEHIESEHGDLRFQCNRCFYRAFSAEHVLMHQAIEHRACFERTLKRAISGKKDQCALIAIERQFLFQTCSSATATTSSTANASDDETEYEDSSDECGMIVSSAEESSTNPNIDDDEFCNIIVCGDFAISNDQIIAAKLCQYFDERAIKLDDEREKAAEGLQCAYCPLEPNTVSSTSRSDQYDDFWTHCVSAHPALPILAYDFETNRNVAKDSSSIVVSEPKDLKSRFKRFASDFSRSNIKNRFGKSASTNEIVYDDATAEKIVTEFRKRLANQFAGTDASNMDASLIRKYYVSNVEQDVRSSSTKKGTKRKSIEGDADVDAEDGASTSTTTAKRTEAGIASKRARIFGHDISESAIRRVKRIGAVAATTAMAIGFFHFTHLLPDSIQSYLDTN